MVRAHEAYARGLDAAIFADDQKGDNLAFDPGRSESIGISRRTRAIP